MSAEKTLNFDDLPEQTLAFIYKGKDYLLVEASGEAVARFRNKVGSSVIMGPEGKPRSVTDLADADFLLVSLCCFEVKDGVRGSNSVSVSTVRSWPYRVQKQLLEHVMRMSPIKDEPDAESLKN